MNATTIPNVGDLYRSDCGGGYSNLWRVVAVREDGPYTQIDVICDGTWGTDGYSPSAGQTPYTWGPGAFQGKRLLTA